ncbi:MAG: GspB domain-containing protein [Desulfobacteraceae bacterium]|nr:GspB domain-containing protein [Desulfobacteraceae bacterium]
MSTILNALKKLEQESLAEETEHPPALNIHLRQERHLWKEKNAWRLWGINLLPWAILLVLLLLGAFVAFTMVTGRFQGETPPAQKAPMPSPVQPSPKKVRALPAETGLPKTAKTPVQRPKRTLDAPRSKPVEAPPRATVKPAMPEMAKTTEIPERIEKTGIPGMPKMPERSEAPPLPLPDRAAAMEERIQAGDKEIPLLEDGRLKINAISWSRQPDERLAVINSAIVREGQTVEGFRLVRIMEDGVIVQRSGRRSRVEFRLR